MAAKLLGKVAIVTGGATGIGEAICKKFAAEGAQVVVCGFPGDPVENVVQEIKTAGGVAEGYSGDVSDERLAAECVALAISTFGKLDILVNNAGVFPEVAPVEKYSVDAFDNLLKNNIRTAFMMTRYALPELQKTKGNIICAGSESGMIGLGKNAAYGGTKGFLHAFTRGVAAEQAANGIRANCVCPGPIDTAWTHNETSDMSWMMEKQQIIATLMGRRGTPEEAANVYLFLASDDASYVTGALYTVDGGITIGKGGLGLMADRDMKRDPEGELDLKHTYQGATEKR